MEFFRGIYTMTDATQVLKKTTKNFVQKTTFKAFIESGNYLIDEVKRRSEKNAKYFFTPDTMRFFSSRVLELAWQKGGSNDPSYKIKDIYFITSEADSSIYKHQGSNRAFTVRKSTSDGSIETIGKFQEHATKRDAQKAIHEIVKGDLKI